MPADQSPLANCVVMDNEEDDLALSSALVVRDDGKDGGFSSPKGIFPPITPLDWAIYCVKDICQLGLSCEGNEDQTALLAAIEEDLSQKVKGACSKGRREFLNLECSINYKTKGAFSRRDKGKAHFFSVRASCWPRVLAFWCFMRF